MSKLNHAINGPSGPQAARAAGVRGSALDSRENVPSGVLARPTGIPGASRDAETARGAALALARGYMYDWHIARTPYSLQRARYMYRVALGLEVPTWK